MKQITNKFGTAEIATIDDVPGKIYCLCTACLSVWTDFLSWANVVPSTMVDKPGEADSIVVLGCQVTDLAVLNDLQSIEALHEQFPDKKFFMSGCLAQRFDIELPEWVTRLDVVRVPYQPLDNLTLVDYQKPFWVKERTDKPLGPGNLFRPDSIYPLKIGAGCSGTCSYCTIRDTRGPSFQTKAEFQVEEFLAHDNVVLIADNITREQLEEWCDLAEKHDHPLSIRNLEPSVAVPCWEKLVQLSYDGLLPQLHVPIQGRTAAILQAMNRSPHLAEELIRYLDVNRATHGSWDLPMVFTSVATNIIVDYPGDLLDDSSYNEEDQQWYHRFFSYVTWNPYWDGKWDRMRAKARWKTYIEDEKYPL